MPPSRPTAEQIELRRAFGARVRHLRQSQGWTQEDLAHRTALDRTYVVGVETGKRNPSLDAIHKIAQGLGVPVGDLFRRD